MARAGSSAYRAARRRRLLPDEQPQGRPVLHWNVAYVASFDGFACAHAYDPEERYLVCLTCGACDECCDCLSEESRLVAELVD